MFSSIIKIWSESKKKPHTRKFMYMGRVAVWYMYVNTLQCDMCMWIHCSVICVCEYIVVLWWTDEFNG